MKNIKILVIDENNVYVGKGEINESFETLLFETLSNSNDPEKCVQNAKEVCQNIEFETHLRSDFRIENSEYNNEDNDMFKFDLTGLIALRLLKGKSISVIVDKYLIGDDEYGYDEMCNFLTSFHEGYNSKIVDGIITENNLIC